MPDVHDRSSSERRRHTNAPFVRSAARAKYGELLASGVRIYEYIPTMLHNKVLVVDINLDSLSMTKNAEEGLAFHDRAFAAEMETMFEEDLRKCREVTERDWKTRSLGHRITELFAGLWEPLY